MTVMPSDEIRWNDEGRRLFQAGRFREARACFARAAADPRARGAALNVAQCDLRLGRPGDAEQGARDLLAKDEAFAPAWQLLSSALADQGDLDGAIAAMKRAVEIAPGDAALRSCLGDLYVKQGEAEAALACYGDALRQHPEDDATLAALVGVKRSVCDWEGLDDLSHRLRRSVQRGRGAAQPLDFLREPASAREQLACAMAWAEARLPVADAPSWPARVARRIGFVSIGFGSHATTILAGPLIEALVRRRIDVHLFAVSPDDGSAWRRRLAAAAPLHDLSTLSPAAMADVVRAQGIEVLFDLDGYMSDRTPALFAQRPSPVQVSWLGYPGTTGAASMDYVVADRFVLPPRLAASFTETVAWLPRCYQPNDPTRPLLPPAPRERYGLPAQGVVYACLNASQKLNPVNFARMLDVVRGVPGSVLWLLEGPGHSAARLRRYALAKGISPERLVFLKRAPHEAYLSALRHADLFLDTDCYNAHTTASDAMWAGCPVLTRPGDTFASRVAGSLNHHAGLHELNADDDAGFVDTAIRVGLEPAFRSHLKARLDAARHHSPLFDMDGFAADLADLLVTLTPRVSGA